MAQNKCLCITCAIFGIIFGIFLFIFLGVFVGLPMAHKESPEGQRDLIYPTYNLLPEKPEFSNFQRYKLPGSNNLHIGVTNDNSVSLGVWHILPLALSNISSEPYFDSRDILAQITRWPVLLYFHSTYGNRALFNNMYKVLRNFFHVITFDYRGYGDSSKATPDEEAIVLDSVQLYKWIRARTNADIYFWGQNVGSAFSTHTIARLREENIIPQGLFLEAPITSIKDQLHEQPFHQWFSWLPWYKWSMIDPLEKNGFVLDTTKYIKWVDCPIMIIHAKDDDITPYVFSEKLYKVAIENQRYDQGNVSLYLLPKSLLCEHLYIYSAPELPQYVQQHINTCQAYNKRRG